MLNFHLDALAQTVHFRLIVPRHQIDFDVPCARTHQKMLPYSRLEVRPELIHEVEKNLSPTLLLLIPELSRFPRRAHQPFTSLHQQDLFSTNALTFILKRSLSLVKNLKGFYCGCVLAMVLTVATCAR